METEDAKRSGPATGPRDASCGNAAATLAVLSKEMEQALVDLQGPLDALELVSETLELRHGTAIAWLVHIASDSAGRLRENWEQLHDLVRSSDAPEHQGTSMVHAARE